MKLKVLSYVEAQDFHICEDEAGKKFNVDILVGSEKGLDLSRKELVGKVVGCEYIFPYSYLAQNTVLAK